MWACQSPITKLVDKTNRITVTYDLVCLYLLLDPVRYQCKLQDNLHVDHSNNLSCRSQTEMLQYQKVTELLRFPMISRLPVVSDGKFGILSFIKQAWRWDFFWAEDLTSYRPYQPELVMLVVECWGQHLSISWIHFRPPGRYHQILRESVASQSDGLNHSEKGIKIDSLLFSFFFFLVPNIDNSKMKVHESDKWGILISLITAWIQYHLYTAHYEGSYHVHWTLQVCCMESTYP